MYFERILIQAVSKHQKGGRNLEPFTDMERIMEQYGDALLRMSYLYLKDYHLAEDAVQDTFLKIYKSYHGFQGKSSEKTWVMRIAINVWKNYLRTGWLRRVVPSPVLLDSLSAEEFPEEDDLLPRILNLPPKYKEVLLLYYYQELKIREISDILHIPESTVSIRLKRAREQLKIQLEGENELEQ